PAAPFRRRRPPARARTSRTDAAQVGLSSPGGWRSSRRVLSRVAAGLGQRRMTAMLLKSAKLASKSDLLTQYWLASRTSLTRTWVGDTPVRVSECSAYE